MSAAVLAAAIERLSKPNASHSGTEYMHAHMLTAAEAEALRGHIAKLELPQTNEVAWLVERRDRSQPCWFFHDELGNFGWTPDANKALRFARKVDGDNFCADWTEDVFVCEHMWCGGP